MKGLLLLLLRSTSPWSPLVVTVGALLFFMRVLRRINIRRSALRISCCCLHVVGEVLYNIIAASDSQPL